MISACVHIRIKGEIGAGNWFKPPLKVLLTVPRRYFFCGSFLMFAMLSRLLIAALWSPAGKWMTSWPSFVVLNCVLSLSHVVSRVRCGT